MFKICLKMFQIYLCLKLFKKQQSQQDQERHHKKEKEKRAKTNLIFFTYSQTFKKQTQEKYVIYLTIRQYNNKVLIKIFVVVFENNFECFAKKDNKILNTLR